MFVERGFDAVRVAEIAEACGVSEKTVFNYFPSKEALIVDHPDATMAALRTSLADVGLTPTEAALRILADELGGMTSWLAAQDDLAQATAKFQHFGVLIQTTPALRAHQRDMTDQLVTVAADALAARIGTTADDPQPKIAAIALLGLWQIQFAALRTYLDGTRTPAQVREAVTADVRSAARLIDTGLSGFATGIQDPGTRPAMAKTERTRKQPKAEPARGRKRR
jgi:AcrR family transcriptional regulator